MFIQNIVKSSFLGVIALFPSWIYPFGRWVSSLRQCAEWYAEQYFPLLRDGFSLEVVIINCVLPSSAFAYHARFSSWNI